MTLGIDHGGWCPRGRLAEDGVIDPVYQLQETGSTGYPERTEKNVIESDGTLILYCGRLFGGTRLTERLALKHARPVHLVDLDAAIDWDAVRHWLQSHKIATLNIAGPRESSQPGIQAQSREVIVELFSR